MIPSWYGFLLIALAAFRTWRLLAIDTFPPVENLRNRILFDGDSEIRPRLAEFLKCPWCLGFWVVLVWWGAWLLWSHGVLVAAVPFALSTVVGTWSARLDP